MGTFYQDMIKIIKDNESSIVKPGKIRPTKDQIKLHKKYKECYDMIFEDSPSKGINVSVYIQKISDYFGVSNDSVTSFSDYLNRIYIGNVSRLQRVKKTLKSFANDLSKNINSNEKKISAVPELSESKELEEIQSEAKTSVSKLTKFTDNCKIHKIKKELKSVKKSLSERHIYTEKTLRNAVYNEGKKHGMIAALKNASEILNDSNASRDDINKSYDLLTHKHPKGFKSGYDKFKEMYEAISKEMNDNNNDDLNYFKSLVRNYTIAANNKATELSSNLNKLNESLSDTAERISESVSDLKHLCSDLKSSIKDIFESYLIPLDKDQNIISIKSDISKVSEKNQETCKDVLIDLYRFIIVEKLISSGVTGSGGSMLLIGHTIIELGGKEICAIILASPFLLLTSPVWLPIVIIYAIYQLIEYIRTAIAKKKYHNWLDSLSYNDRLYYEDGGDMHN